MAVWSHQEYIRTGMQAEVRSAAGFSSHRHPVMPRSRDILSIDHQTPIRLPLYCAEYELCVSQQEPLRIPGLMSPIRKARQDVYQERPPTQQEAKCRS